MNNCVAVLLQIHFDLRVTKVIKIDCGNKVTVKIKCCNLFCRTI